MSKSDGGRHSDPVVIDNDGDHRFEIHVGGEVAGYAVYERDAGVTSFVHTTIGSRFEGEGLGSILARHALDASRKAGEEILPICPFIRHFIQTHPEYADLVPAERHAEFELP